jgi:hypothetical protein
MLTIVEEKKKERKNGTWVPNLERENKIMLLNKQSTPAFLLNEPSLMIHGVTQK